MRRPAPRQLLFVEEPAAVYHQIALALVHAQPIVEATENRVGILQLRLIPFVSPDVQARRIESGKLRPLLQLPDERLEALQFGGPDRYFSTARHGSDGWLVLEKRLIFLPRSNLSAFNVLFMSIKRFLWLLKST